MSAPRVFLDTGIFVAAMNGRDRYHKQARAMFAGTPRFPAAATNRSRYWATSR